MPQDEPTARPTAAKREPGSGYDDEISLVDLWRVLERRRWWIAGITATVFVLGLLFALAKPLEYRFQTTLQLPTDAAQEPLVSTAELKELVQQLLVPQAEAELGETEPAAAVPDVRLIEIESPRVLVLRSVTTPDNQGLVETLHSRVLALVREEFEDDVTRVRGSLEDRLARRMIEHADTLRQSRLRQAGLAESMASAKSEHAEALREFDARQNTRTEALVATKTQYVDTLREMNARQISRERQIRDLKRELQTLDQQSSLIERQLASIEPLREEFAGQATLAEPGFVAFIQEARTTLLGMQQRLEREQAVDIPRALIEHESNIQRLTRELEDAAASRETLVQRQEIEIARLERELQERVSERAAMVARQAVEIAQLERQLQEAEAEHESMAQIQSIERASLERTQNQVRDTEARGTVAARAHRAEGRGRAQILALSLVLGGMLGVFGAFFREFLENARAVAE